MGVLKGKVALISGASRGIGRAIAKKLASRDAKIVAVARNSNFLKELGRVLSEFDTDAKHKSPVPVDKGDMLSPEDIAEAVYFMLTRPEGVALNEITIRPNWQER